MTLSGFRETSDRAEVDRMMRVCEEISRQSIVMEGEPPTATIQCPACTVGVLRVTQTGEASAQFTCSNPACFAHRTTTETDENQKGS